MLLDLAEPLLRHIVSDDPEKLKRVINLATAAWNFSLIPPEERADAGQFPDKIERRNRDGDPFALVSAQRRCSRPDAVFLHDVEIAFDSDPDQDHVRAATAL